MNESNPTLELMQILGWQGGTIHQVCKVLNCTIEDILYNGEEKLEEIKERAKSYKAKGDSMFENIFGGK